MQTPIRQISPILPGFFLTKRAPVVASNRSLLLRIFASTSSEGAAKEDSTSCTGRTQLQKMSAHKQKQLSKDGKGGVIKLCFLCLYNSSDACTAHCSILAAPILFAFLDTILCTKVLEQS